MKYYLINSKYFNQIVVCHKPLKLLKALRSLWGNGVKVYEVELVSEAKKYKLIPFYGIKFCQTISVSNKKIPVIALIKDLKSEVKFRHRWVGD